MTDIVIRGGRLIDATGETVSDLAISGGRIVPIDEVAVSATEIDASGCIVSTGLVDLFTSLGEPGDEAAETITSGTTAAVAGGYTTLLASPSTIPPVDSAAAVEHVRTLTARALCNVEIAGTVTIDGAGQRLAPLGELAAAGVRWVGDEGSGIQNPRLLRRALEYTRPMGLVLAQRAHCDELAGEAQMHEGAWSATLGLSGTPAVAEEVTVVRDLALARLVGARIHFRSLSSAGSVAILGAGRSGAAVSADVAVANLSFVDADLATYDTNLKLDPPLRSVPDQRALLAACSSQVVDAVTSGHRPHPSDRKERPFDHAESGSASLETALAAALTAGLEPAEALRAMSWRPAELLGLGSAQDRSLRVGCVADVTIFDPDATFEVDARSMATAGANSAWQGRTLRGLVRTTIVDGSIVYHGDERVPDNSAKSQYQPAVSEVPA